MVIRLYELFGWDGDTEGCQGVESIDEWRLRGKLKAVVCHVGHDV